MASITKQVTKSGGIHHRVEIRVKGRKAVCRTFHRHTDAKQWAASTEADIRSGLYLDRREAELHTVDEMIDRFLTESVKFEGFSQNEIVEYERCLAMASKELGSFRLSDITTAKLSAYRDTLLKTPSKHTGKPLSPGSVVRYMARLSKVFTVAVRDWDWLESNPIHKVKKPKLSRGRDRFLLKPEISCLLSACEESANPYLLTAVVIALSTGIRQGELMSLKWKDVDLKKGRCILHHTKNGEKRPVTLSGKALSLLKQQRTNHRNIATNLVFPGKPIRRNGKLIYKPINLRKAWVAALAAAKIEDFKWHDLRHTCASHLAMNGASLAEIAEVLGHKTLQMVKRYAHLTETHTAKVVTSMNEKMFGE